ncbi:MAG: hypothetical protein Ct9H300mP9_7800 [Candidatus Neomarinimicrobiota bacterium]|nr:MAG: hypothetical protein Ct9H300mP9_7800 [Candidatus Neomarinimicrobiota bacterium]
MLQSEHLTVDFLEDHLNLTLVAQKDQIIFKINY